MLDAKQNINSRCDVNKKKKISLFILIDNLKCKLNLIKLEVLFYKCTIFIITSIMFCFYILRQSIRRSKFIYSIETFIYINKQT